MAWNKKTANKQKQNHRKETLSRMTPIGKNLQFNLTKTATASEASKKLQSAMMRKSAQDENEKSNEREIHPRRPALSPRLTRAMLYQGKSIEESLRQGISSLRRQRQDHRRRKSVQAIRHGQETDRKPVCKSGDENPLVLIVPTKKVFSKKVLQKSTTQEGDLTTPALVTPGVSPKFGKITNLGLKNLPAYRTLEIGKHSQYVVKLNP